MIKYFFARPVTLQLGKVSLRATPKQLGASAYVGDAVKRARIVKPGANVPLKVAAPLPRIQRYVAGLARRFDRTPVDSELSLRNGKPFVTKERVGRRLRQSTAVRAVFHSLKTHDREPIALRTDALITAEDAGVDRRRDRDPPRLQQAQPLRRHEAAPDVRRRHRPIALPDAARRVRDRRQVAQPLVVSAAVRLGAGREPIPPGPGNPLGTRWMGISAPAVGIHGTPDPASIGYSVSHGCIRMLIPEVEWLFNQVDVGTPVYIVR